MFLSDISQVGMPTLLSKYTGVNMHFVIDGTSAINTIRAIQRYNWNLITEMAGIDNENEFSLLYLGYRPEMTLPPVTNPNFHPVNSSISGKLLNLSWKLTSFPDISFWVKKPFDLVHFPGGSAYIPNNCKAVLTTLHGFHDYAIPQHTEFSGRYLLIKNLEKTIKNSTNFITVSENNKNELIRFCGVVPEKITAIPLGISPEFRKYELDDEIKNKIRKRYSLRNKKIVLFVGALEPHKNIHGIIEAYSLLDGIAKNNLDLVFVGSKTKYQDKYQNLIRQFGITDNVRFIDYIVPGSIDLAYIYNLAELFIFPTFYEGWASPPLEAMKCGVPAIVSNIPSLIESTGGIATYCDPYNPEDIAEKMMEVLSDRSKCQKLKQDGLQFSSEYTWRRCAEKTLHLYKRLLLQIN